MSKRYDYTIIIGGVDATAVFNMMGGPSQAQRFLAGKLVLVEFELLRHVRDFNVAASSGVTTSEEWWREAGVAVFDHSFPVQFVGVKINSAPAGVLEIQRLEKKSTDNPILEDLGDFAEISPLQFHQFLAENKKSLEWFVAYLRGKDGKLWAVRAIWGPKGWHLYAAPTGYVNTWDTERHFVSRKKA